MRPADALLLADMRAWCQSGDARAIRERAGLTRVQAGGSCGVTGRAVGLWECGQRVPTGERAMAYARLLRSLQKKAA